VTKEDVHRAIVSSLAQIAPEADLAHLDPDGDLREELDLDSMDFLRFVQTLHRSVGVDVPERDYREVRTLSSCVEYCAARATPPGAAGSPGV
jgi:acyl carrier protein